MTTVFFAWQGRVRGFLVLGDALRAGTVELMQELRKRGKLLCLISGDAQETTRAVAEALGILRFRGQALPGDKVDLVKALQQEGHRVGMVGDGVNDAAALVQADVGFSLGTGSNIIREASDVTFVAPEPGRVLDVFSLSEVMARAIRQNLFFAFSYNAIGIPLAAAGWLSPPVAVLAMFLSSLTVIGNSLRVARRKKR